MIYKLGNKEIKIDEKIIQHYCNTLDITQDEAIEMYLSDNDYVNNDIVDKLTAKAKENKTDKIIVTDKTKARKKSEHKVENPVKTEIIKKLCKCLQDNGYAEVNITNDTKYIDFSTGGECFTVNLIQHRKKGE